MDSIDKLLAQLKAEYEPGKPAPQPDILPPITSPQSKSQSIIDNMLAEVKADVEEQKTAEDLLTQTEYQPGKTTQLQPNLVSQLIPSPPKPPSIIDNILAEVKADVEEQEAAEELRKRQELEQERIRQEKIKAQQLEALRKPAKEWLEKLDPFSSEGLWFERFAEGYPSKLEAAIEYLQNNQ